MRLILNIIFGGVVTKFLSGSKSGQGGPYLEGGPYLVAQIWSGQINFGCKNWSGPTKKWSRNQ